MAEDTPNPGGTPLPGTRTFYSAASAENFIQHFEEVLEEQHKATLVAQDSLIRQVNEPIVALTSKLDRLIELLDPMPPRRSQSSSPNRGNLDPQIPSNQPPPQFYQDARLNLPPYPPIPQQQPPPVPPRQPSLTPPEIPPVSPYRSSRTPFPRERTAPPPPPVREMTGFTTASGAFIPNGESSRLPGIKVPKFRGEEGENVMAWLYELDSYFLLANVKEHQKVATVTMGLRGDARTFAYYLVVTNKGLPLPWHDFRLEFINKYENAETRGLLLRQQLNTVRYHGPDRMVEYCEEFRKIEAQIYDMAFLDRVQAFVSKIHPPQAATHILNAETLQNGRMEFVYQLARQWATNYRIAGNLGNGSSRHSRHTHSRRLLKFGKTKSSSPSSSPTTTAKKAESEDDLDYIQPEDLNRMDLMQVTCYNCGKRGHFKRNCKSPPKDKQVNFNKSSYGSSGTSRSLYQAAEVDDAPDDKPSYGVLDPSSSESSDMETDSDDLNLMSTYEFNHDHTSVKSNNGLISRKLPVYDSRLNDEPAKTIIDCGASTLFVNEDMAKKMGASVTKIRKPRKVNVAGKRVIMIDGFCTFEMKLGDLPVETVTAYTFPLGTGIDLILGLPWLAKHNPHIDWQLCSAEFNRNGRRYMLWPAKPMPTIKIASPDEFAEFVDKSTSLYLIQRRDLLGNPPSPSPDTLF